MAAHNSLAGFEESTSDEAFRIVILMYDTPLLHLVDEFIIQ